MSHSDITTWRITDKNGNELDFYDVFVLQAFNIEELEYDPDKSVLNQLRDAIDAETTDDT